MDMIEVHKDARKKSVVFFNDFLYEYKPDRKRVYAFVEGRDDPSFYRSVFLAELPQDWECRLIRPGGKKRVMEVFDLFDWDRFPRQAICFFIDRDLADVLPEDLPEEPNVYITDDYAIENHLVCADMMKRILEEDKGVSGLRSEEEEQLGQIYCDNYSFFIDGMASVMAQVVIIRRAEAAGVNIRARLDKVRPMRFFTFNGGRMAYAAGFDDPFTRACETADAVGASRSSKEDVERVAQEFRDLGGPKRFTRGKYLIQFLVACCEELRIMIPSLCARFTTPPGSPGIISSGTATVLLGPRCRCPQSLKSFIHDNYLNYIGGWSAAA